MLINSDCLEWLKTQPENSIDSLITDPPAGIGFMGKEWDHHKGGRDQWIAWMQEVMTECLRVMKPGAHGFVWAIPRTSHWTATALENAGFEIRDVVTHLFGSGFPKSHNISKAIDKKFGKERKKGELIRTDPNIKGNNYKNATERIEIRDTLPESSEAKQWDGWGTAAKPSVEMWLLIAKPFTTVPLDNIISEINSYLRDIICQQLNAKYVNQISTSNLKDLKMGEKSDFAQWIVVVLNTLKSVESLEKTDMFKSQEMVKTSLNIVLLWKGILDVLLNLQSTFIIKMESSLIIELKILNCLILETIQENTTKDETNQNGQLSNVINVELILKNALLKLKGLMEITVQESVSTKAENLKNQIQQDYVPEIAKDVLSSHYILVRKPLSEKTIVDNVLKWGTGGINIDGSRIDFQSDKDKISAVPGGKISYLSGGFGQSAGLEKVLQPKMQPPQGRFPANLTLDEYAAELLDEQSGITKSNNKPRNNSDFKSNSKGYEKAHTTYGHSDSGGASRFFYCAKASKSERNAGLGGMPSKFTATMNDGIGKREHNEKELSAYNQNFHPTVKPIKLMKYLINMITPPNGIVLDPFMGSGSTGVAAKQLGFDFIGIEKEKEYFEIAEKRIKN